MNTQESAVPSVFFTAPFAEHDRVLEKSLTRAVSEVGAILRYPGDSFGTVGAFLDDIRNSSVVVCDVSSRNPNVMLELGFAEALKKPIILLSKTSHDAPVDLTNRRYLIYGSFESVETLKLVLIQLLVSADFLASDFIVDDELPPLLKAAEEGGTVILPLILKPCRFARDPHLKQFQAINDPKRSLITLPEDQQEALYDLTAEAVEKAIPIVTSA